MNVDPYVTMRISADRQRAAQQRASLHRLTNGAAADTRNPPRAVRRLRLPRWRWWLARRVRRGDQQFLAHR
jgi:hypothetical protein